MTKLLSSLVLLVAFLPNLSWSCSCVAMIRDIEVAVQKAFENADSVVLAEAENVTLRGEYTEITQFVAKRSWKGTHGKRFYTRIDVQCCVCGFPMEKGRSYLLYLYKSDEGYYRTSICTRSTTEGRADDDIRILDALTPNNAMEQTDDRQSANE